MLHGIGHRISALPVPPGHRKEVFASQTKGINMKYNSPAVANCMKLALSFNVAVPRIEKPKTQNANVTARRKLMRIILRPTVVCSHSGKMMLMPENAKKAMPIVSVPTRKFRPLESRCGIIHLHTNY
jgi:hypothetical protein